VPAQQRLRPHRELVPAAARHDPAERRYDEPVARLEPGLTHLPTEDRQLVPQHENLELLRTIPANEQQQKRQQPAKYTNATSNGGLQRRERRRYRHLAKQGLPHRPSFGTPRVS
jgi:hypothetical protein